MLHPCKVIPPAPSEVPLDVRLRILHRLQARIGPAEFGKLLTTLGEEGLLKLYFFQLQYPSPAKSSEHFDPKWKQWLRENGLFIPFLLTGGIIGMICGFFEGREPEAMALWQRLVGGFLAGVTVIAVTVYILENLLNFVGQIFSRVKNFLDSQAQGLAAMEKERYMLKHDLKEFVTFECPVCGESMTERASRWGGSLFSAKQGNVVTCEYCRCQFTLEP